MCIAKQGKPLNTGIAEFYDESTALWEDMWGDHLHHGRCLLVSLLQLPCWPQCSLVPQVPASSNEFLLNCQPLVLVALCRVLSTRRPRQKQPTGTDRYD